MRQTIDNATNFQTPEPTNAEELLCPGESIFVNNIEYNEVRAERIEKLPSGNGCDSIVNIQLDYLEMPELQMITK